MQFLGWLSSYLPWILYFIISGSRYLNNEVAALAALAAAIIFNLPALRKKIFLEWCTVFYFALLSILLLTPAQNWIAHYGYILSNVVFAGIMWFSILIKQPFTLQYAKLEVEEIYWTTPPFRHINYAISLVWAIAVTLMAVDGVLQEVGILPDNWFSDGIIVALILFAIWFTQWFPDWYQSFLFRRFSKELEDPSANPHLQGNYAPVKNELTATNCPVEGTLPENLSGIYMRNGPNPAFPPISYTYPFDGDGMLHAVYLDKGKADYRNRFVETKGLLAERRANRALYGGITKPIPIDPKLIGFDAAMGPIKDGAFIHIIRHANRHLAMWESGPAYEVTAELKTIGEWCPPNTSGPFNINAHTRLDPHTGELYGFTYHFRPPFLVYYVFDKNGELKQTIPIDKQYPSMIHDFIITRSFVIFFDCPAVFNLNALAKGEPFLEWQHHSPTRIAVINKKDHTVQWFEVEPFFVFHFANAYEKDGKIFAHYVRYEKLILEKAVDESIPPKLFCTMIDLQKKSVQHSQLLEHAVEFPRINDRYNSLENRFIYLPTAIDSSTNEFNALIKFDTHSQTTDIHNFGKSAEIGEAVYAPKNSSTGEDDGFMMLFVYDASSQKSDFVLVDCKNFSDQPVAKVKLPQRVPHGLHGSWMAED